MAFGFERWEMTSEAIEASCAIRRKANEVIAAARAGRAPIRVIASDLSHILGSRRNNSLVGRLLREWLGPAFKVRGRVKWPRENGTESGTIYLCVG